MTDEEITAAEQAAGDEIPTDLVEVVAQGGPLDGSTMTCRRPAGVLLVDRPAGLVWRYELRMGDLLVCLDGNAGRRLDAGDDSRERAADEGLWDVQAAPWVGGEPDEVDQDDDPEALTADACDVDVPAELGDEVTGPIDETGV